MRAKFSSSVQAAILWNVESSLIIWHALQKESITANSWINHIGVQDFCPLFIGVQEIEKEFRQAMEEIKGKQQAQQKIMKKFTRK